jgi:hypothetical protein
VGAFFRKPAVVAVIYSFFLEAIVGNMPGYLKRASLTFYTRCMMFEPLEKLGISPPERTASYGAVSAATALYILIGASVLFLIVGMAVFARTEYHEIV